MVKNLGLHLVPNAKPVWGPTERKKNTACHGTALRGIFQIKDFSWRWLPDWQGICDVDKDSAQLRNDHVERLNLKEYNLSYSFDLYQHDSSTKNQRTKNTKYSSWNCRNSDRLRCVNTCWIPWGWELLKIDTWLHFRAKVLSIRAKSGGLCPSILSR